MAKQHIISGIDIGNSQVKAIIARFNTDNLTPEILGAGSAPSNGLRKGAVVDMEETVENIRTAVQRAEAMSGNQIKRAYLAVNGLHIRTQISRGVIAVSRADNEISQSDIDRVIQAASVISMPANREIIHVVPRNYIVDGVEYVKNPIGMKGVRLEAEVLIIDGLSPYLRNMAKCVNAVGIEVSGLVYAPLASSLAVLDKNQKEYGVINLDFGGGTSSLAVFEESDMLYSSVLPIGSRHITNDLAVLLRTSIDVAERVKLEHGATSDAEDLRKKSEVDLSKLLGEDNFRLPKKQLVRAIDARVHELFDVVGNELKKIPRGGLLPAGIVLSGGGANLPGIALLAKERFKLPVRIARALHVDGIADIVDDPSFAVAIGLVMWGIQSESEGPKSKGGFSSDNGESFKKLKEWFKNFLP
ncbi:MAG: cell division protein FtsA [Candidatus Yanofskybacteria bacterium RIFCSPHIGHO2_02_FULL_44_12b]|uniref:Cell division protein FtsA n=2 Tax=Candidatus Yanofskyibacteriota TaxID=1752733 RepID=A0A1F8GKC5_9BACT|nr:MAG: Cell division protein ftsA [Candidatus Yanofskybacteria bacterium GW2011_GWA2_44_9]OGN04851.1 MAG: cell division protein FtsA [Candidatus Yanofskybacteria bacterium RIFCSPHIGHO2_01_FULL_44_24]OGN14075.1 MAG: cell division protein FtsA [Candidatus Yanofskybacteria bacterium RIFCSPHIGHO2_02_FULL_44_12b]OGN25168.1 MAG: cell division protein FtsA [Candidatus Yanofskybacteria bacterium RIFCSPLOWO2_01_FULL_44_22]